MRYVSWAAPAARRFFRCFVRKTATSRPKKEGVGHCEMRSSLEAPNCCEFDRLYGGRPHGR
jgi:hypothetical protein